MIISLNEVFGDIMVLALPLRPPVDPNDINALFQPNLIMLIIILIDPV